MATCTSRFFLRAFRDTSTFKNVPSTYAKSATSDPSTQYQRVVAATSPPQNLQSSDPLPAHRVNPQQQSSFPAVRRASRFAPSAIPAHSISLFHTCTALNMSSDADYAAFLDKANQDTGGATTQSSKSYSTKSVNTAVPEGLQSIEEYYVSDADEPFEPVALKFDGLSISADELKKLLGHDSEVSETQVKGFESQYKKVMDAVKQAGNGEVKFFRVEHGGTRAEYYVVSVDEKGERIVGLKALSVES